MSGQGKYTNYSDNIPEPSQGGTSSSRLQFLKSLFKGGPDLSMKAVIDRAKSFLVPSAQPADPTIYGGPVDLDYKNAPNLEDVKWSKPGDPSTPYTPDLRSPGVAPNVDLGSTDTVMVNLTPADGDPNIAPGTISPNYVVANPDSGTKSPNVTSAKVSSQELGTSGVSSVVTNNSAGEIYK